MGELLQAARSPATRRRSTSAGRATTARRSCGCRCRSGARRAVDPHRVPRARPGVQPVPRVLGDARRRASRASTRATTLPPEATEQHLRDDRRGARWPRASARCRSRSRDALDVMEQSELVAEDARRARVRVLPPQQARGSGTEYKAYVTPLGARPLPRDAVGDGRRHGRLEPRPRLSRPAAAAARADARPRRARRGRRSRTRRSRCSTSRPTAGRARSSCADDDPEGAFALCRSLRKGDARARVDPAARISGAQLARARAPRRPLRRLLPLAVPPEGARGAAAAPAVPRRARRRARRSSSYGDLVLNFETYQAAIGGQPLDLTYMEYELLKFFVDAPGQGVHA